MHKVVEKRLRDVVESHEIALSLMSSRNAFPIPSQQDTSSTAKAAQLRSFTTLHNNTNMSIADLDLNPPERAKPQDLLKGCHLYTTLCASVPCTIQDDGASSGVQSQFQNLQLHGHLDYHKTSIKAITTMSALCDEVYELSAISKKKFLPQLHLFCHDLKLDAYEKDKEVNMLDEVLMIQRDEEMLKRIGKFIAVLQNCYNFVNRIQRLVKNMVCQIHGCLEPLYDWSIDAESLGSKNGHTAGNMDEPKLFSSVQNAMPIVEGIAELLEILIEIDGIIANNTELLEAWDVYKSIVMESGNDSIDDRRDMQRPVSFVNVRLDNNIGSHAEDVAKITVGDDGDAHRDGHGGDHGDTDGDDHGDSAIMKDNCAKSASTSASNCEEDINNDSSQPYSNKDLTMLRRMLMQLDFTLLSSRSFLIAIEQKFDPRNEVFQENSTGKSNILHEYVKQGVEMLYRQCCQTLGTKEQWTHRTPIVGLYGLYCLYRRLLPSNTPPDENLHKSLCVLLPSHRPVLPMFGELPFFPAEFISRYAPLERVKGFTPITMDDIRLQAKRYISKEDKNFVATVSELYRQGLLWSVSAEYGLGFSAYNADDLSGHEDYNASPETTVVHQITLIRKGIDIAKYATSLLRCYLAMHKNLLEPIPSGHLSSLEKLCYLAKSVEQVLKRRQWSNIVSIHKAALKTIASSLFQKLEALR